MKKAHLYRWMVGGSLLVMLLFVAVELASSVSAAVYTGPSGFVPLDQEYLIVRGPGDLFRPALADGSLMVWYTRGADGLDVFGLRLGDDGRASGEPFLVAGGRGNQALPAIAASTEGGGYLVVWHQLASGGADVYARYLSADGRLLGDPFAVAALPNDQLRPAVAYVPAADVFLVVWQDSRGGGAADLYARLVLPFDDSAGDVKLSLTDEFVVSDAPGGQYIPDVVCEVTRPRCLVVWQDDRNSARFHTDILGRLIRVNDGATVGDEIEVAVEADYQYSPSVVYNPVSAEYLVVWDDDISARRLSRTGQPRGKKVDISLESTYQYKPVIAVGADGTFLIVWEDLRNWNTRGADVYGQWLSRTGLPIGPNFAVSTDAHNQYSPAMVSLGGRDEHAFFIVWEDSRVGVANLSLFGRWLAQNDGDR